MADTPVFNHNITLAEEALGIGGENPKRRLLPVSFRVAKVTNPSGTSLGTLKLYLWAKMRIQDKPVTLEEFLELFGEHWWNLRDGKCRPNEHANLREILRLNARKPNHTLRVSDVVEISQYPFAQL